MRLWILLLAIVAAIATWRWHAGRPADWQGRPAAAAPRQWTTDLPPAWTRGDYRIAPLARFSIRAVVLSRCDYRGGHAGALSRTDLALGWGAMSEAAVVNRVKVSQDMRWYQYSWRGELPVPPAEIGHSSANMHLIPADDDVARELARVRRHEIVEISGHLIEASHPDGWTWRSSLSRTDSGAGACEVIWVESLKRHPAGAR